jgi:nucleoside-diphosphate-sugar epimerase
VIAVSGVSGLIGKNLVRLFDELSIEWCGVSATKLSNSGDVLRACKSLKISGVDTFVHLGWPLRQSTDYRTSTDNIRAAEISEHLAVELCRQGIKCFMTGSAAEYDSQPTKYGEAKIRLRKHLNPFIDEGQLGWLRPWYVYDGNVWPSYVREAREGGIPVLSDDRSLFFVDVRDVADGVVAAISNSLSGEIDIALGTSHKPSELLSALELPFRVERSGLSVPENRVPNLLPLSDVGWRAHRTISLFETKSQDSILPDSPS